MNQTDILEQYYILSCVIPSDINEHLPLLRELSKNCKTITEMGVRGVVSTFAFVSSDPSKLTCIDLFHPSYFNAKHRIDVVEEYCKRKNIIFSMITADTLSIDIEETDFLFIDTLHTYQQLKEELKKHSHKVKKYIGFHDTTLFEYTDENATSDVIEFTNKKENLSKQGLWTAISEFLEENKCWKIKERRTNNNGLTILERI